ncbi:hypothetical protein M0G74_15040 [Microbulbifer sp. CAU 1566]|uniref:dienelactone hydrolase family protein n=1 Tax=Microbulbifer sp. CAU 1566 TaxID=2933269 RepID=UPI0020034985|nr:hypothetical protein [Microbulbifer sp. CAU 1566]MCK7598593.1 hypothetical protein [Microbulbifer sp. CAU 1566]
MKKVMMKNQRIKSLLPALGIILGGIFSGTTAQAQSCPSDAICRYEDTPGSYSDNGPFRYDSYSMPAFSTPGGATVYYPTDAAPPYSLLVFTPPYTGTQIMYRDWGPFFASHGIVLVTMDSRTIYDSVDSRADQQQDVLDAMKDENTRYGSPLRGKLDTSRFGATGWSMGGGATWITSAEYSGLKTAMSFAGHNLTAVDSDSSGRNTRIPTILFNGSLDTTYLGGLGQSDGVYRNIPNGVPKLFYEASNAGHFVWGGPEDANRYVGQLALAFQKTYLDGDTRWAQFLDRPPLYVAEFEKANIP